MLIYTHVFVVHTRHWDFAPIVGPANQTQFGFLSGITLDTSRNILYFADQNYNIVYKLNLTSNIVSIIAG